MMIPNLFTRPATTWVSILVVVLHGAVAWAMVSVDDPAPIITEKKPKVIHLELITLASTPDKVLPSTKASSTIVPSTELQTKPLTQNPSSSNAQPTESTEKAETVKPLSESKVVEPLKTKTEPKEKQKQTTPKENKKPVKEDLNAKDEPENFSSEKTLIIVESRRVVSRADKDDTEDDLSAMIRAVTAQFNREQAMQQRAANNQTNRKLMEQEQWRIQAANEAVSKMLELAAAQAENQKNAEIDSEDNVDNKNEDTAFLANDGSWMAEHEPITSFPALFWRSISRDLGDVFIVMLELHVDKEGSVTEVQLLESSGSPIIDAIATTQVEGGRLNPFIQNGAAVDAIVPMSLAYERP